MSVLIIPKRFTFSNLLGEIQSLQKGSELKALYGDEMLTFRSEVTGKQSQINGINVIS